MRSLRMPPSQRPEEGGLISFPVQSIPAFSLVFSIRMKPRLSLGRSQSLQSVSISWAAFTEAAPVLWWVFPCVDVLFLPCLDLWHSSFSWTIRSRHSEEQTETCSHWPPWLYWLLWTPSLPKEIERYGHVWLCPNPGGLALVSSHHICFSAHEIESKEKRVEERGEWNWVII